MKDQALLDAFGRRIRHLRTAQGLSQEQLAELTGFHRTYFFGPQIRYIRIMTDVHDPKTRSYNMSRIRSKDTKPEMIVRHFLFSRGFRYRLHDRRLPGKPDIVLPKYKTVIFVHGCFWHGHEGCRYFVVPKTRTDWWLSKINLNKAKDQQNLRLIQTNGWNTFTIFECELRKEYREKSLDLLVQAVRSYDFK